MLVSHYCVIILEILESSFQTCVWDICIHHTHTHTLSLFLFLSLSGLASAFFLILIICTQSNIYDAPC
jgi:hypothetical protein